jgi:hypothetical protein
VSDYHVKFVDINCEFVQWYDLLVHCSCGQKIRIFHISCRSIHHTFDFLKKKKKYQQLDVKLFVIYGTKRAMVVTLTQLLR